jgi:hypothetical protein
MLTGGAYKRNGSRGITSVPHRDLVIGIVYDVFYDTYHETTATALQSQMQALLRQQDYDANNAMGIRVLWGPFEFTAAPGYAFNERVIHEMDMKDEKVWRSYYGSDGPYRDLQALKKDVDPLDVFTNSFTVQMPRGTVRPREG